MVFGEEEQMPAYRGRTHDLSFGGTGLLTDANLFTLSPVVILLAPAPSGENYPQQAIEITARQVFCVHSGKLPRFRLGFQFTHFKGDGLKLIKESLAHHQASRRRMLGSHLS